MKSSFSLRGRLPSAVAIVALSLASAISAQAATDTWTGGSADWNTSSNWNTTAGPVPGSGDTALFNSGATPTSITLTTGPENLNSLTFNTSSVAAYTIGLSTDPALTLSAGGIIQTTSTVANAEVINVPLTLVGAYSISSNSSNSADTLTIGGAITLANSTSLTLAGTNTGTNTISGAIGGGNGTSGLIKSGSGNWTLTGASTYTGPTVLNGGTLTLNAGSADTGTLAATAITGNGGTFIFTNSNTSGTQTQVLGAVTASVGATTIENAETSTGSSKLTVASNTRSTGATINYVETAAGASIFTTTAAGNPGTVVGNGIFFTNASGVTNYAVETSAGAIAAPTYAATGTYRDTADNSNAINGSANWLVNSTSVLTSSNLGLNTVAFNGSYTLSTGTLFTGGLLVSGGQATISGALRDTTSFSANQDMVINTAAASDSLNISGGFSEGTTGVAVGITKTGSGTLTLSGTADSYAGTVYVDQGTFKSTIATGLGFGGGLTVGNNVGSTIVQANSTLDIGASGGFTVNEPIVLNSGNLTNSSSGTTIIGTGLVGIQYTNTTGVSTGFTQTVSGGGGSGATITTPTLGLSLASITLSGGTGYKANDALTVTGGGAGSGATLKVLTVDGNGGILTYSLTAAGSGYTATNFGITDTTTGAASGASVTGNNGNFVLVGNETVSVAGSGYTSAPTVSFSSGTGSATAVISSVALDGTANTIGGSTSGGNLTINAVVADGTSSGGFTKIGTDTLTLNGVNTYTGATFISAGTLALGAGGSIATTPSINVASGATYDVHALGGYSLAAGQTLSGAGTVNNTGFTTTIAASAILQPSNVTGIATQLTFNGNLALAGSTKLTIYSGSTDSVAISSGTLTYGGTMTVAVAGTEVNNTYVLFSGQTSTSADFTGVTVDGTALTDSSGVWSGVGANGENATFYTTGVNDGDLIFAPASVPEPGTWVLILFGCAVLVPVVRRHALKSTAS